jgi:hypothetical protein
MEPIKVGDLVVTGEGGVAVRDELHPTYSARGRERIWESGCPTLVVDIGFRKMGGTGVRKFRILLEGELWWVSEIWAHRVETKDEG